MLKGIVVASSPRIDGQCYIQLIDHTINNLFFCIKGCTDSIAIGTELKINDESPYLEGGCLEFASTFLTVMPALSHNCQRIVPIPLPKPFVVTSVIDEKIGIYQLTNGIRVLALDHLQIGQSYTFHNSFERGLFDVNFIISCPLYALIEGQSKMPVATFDNWSICDRAYWLGNKNSIEMRLAGLVSKTYFQNIDLYEQLGLKCYNAIAKVGTEKINLLKEFTSHHAMKECRFCRDSVFDAPFLDKDCLKGSMIGLVDIDEYSGRFIIRNGIQQFYLISTNALCSLDHLVYIAHAQVYQLHKLQYLVSDELLIISPIAKKLKRKSCLLGIADLIVVNDVHRPNLLSKEDPNFTCHLEGNKFATLGGKDGQKEKENEIEIEIKSVVKSPFEGKINASKVARCSISRGSIIVNLVKENDFLRLDFVSDETLTLKNGIKILNRDEAVLQIACSKTVFDYLAESSRLASGHNKDHDDSDEEKIIAMAIKKNAKSIKRLVAVVMEYSFLAASEIGLSPLMGSHVTQQIQGDKYLVVSLKQSLRRYFLALPPGFFLPLGLFTGAKICASNLLIVKRKDHFDNYLLLPSSMTKFEYLKRLDEGEIFNFPNKFLFELEHDEYATITGTFIKLIRFQAQNLCSVIKDDNSLSHGHPCRSIIKNERCLSHGKLSSDMMRFEAFGYFSFSDGKGNLMIAFEGPEFHKLAPFASIDMKRLKALAIEAPITYHPLAIARDPHQNPALSKVANLLSPFSSQEFKSQDFILTGVTRSVHQPQNWKNDIQRNSSSLEFKVISIAPVDYFDQCRKLIGLGMHH